ncbi:MAG TPA: hypothetical protein VEW48_01950 [Thermoanaerobaculia bacterium]|nr:hypothetical protein [Thermoanaerobaculia bacterium]
MKALLIALTAAVLSATSLTAQSLTLGPDIPVATAGDQTRVAASPGGGFAVAWRDNGVFLRAFSSAGTPLSGAVQLSTQGATLSALYPRIAALAAGGYVVAWAYVEDVPFEPVHQPMVGVRIVGASGQPAGPEILLPAGTSYPDVAAYPTGGFLLTWTSQQAVGTFARRFDDHGSPVSGEMAIPGETWEQLATLPGGGFVLARTRYLPVPGWDSDVLFQIFGPDGLPAGPEVQVNGTDLPDHIAPQISADATGHFAIAWRAWDNQRGTPRQIRARVFGPDGTAQTPEITVRTATPQEAVDPQAVALRADGSFLVLWFAGAKVDLFARWFRADGVPAGEAFPIQDGTGYQLDGDAEPTADGWIVTWTNGASLSNGPHVRRLGLPCGGGLCLNGNRFRAEVTWRVPATGAGGIGNPVPLTVDTGAFWFFQPSNAELVLKVLDGRGLNGHFWVFYGSLTNVEFDLTVTDTVTGEQRTYHNPAGTMASRADTTAF